MLKCKDLQALLLWSNAYSGKEILHYITIEHQSVLWLLLTNCGSLINCCGNCGMGSLVSDCSFFMIPLYDDIPFLTCKLKSVNYNRISWSLSRYIFDAHYFQICYLIFLYFIRFLNRYAIDPHSTCYIFKVKFVPNVGIHWRRQVFWNFE